MGQEARIRIEEGQNPHPVAKDATRVGHPGPVGHPGSVGHPGLGENTSLSTAPDGPKLVGSEDRSGAVLTKKEESDSPFAVSVGEIYEGPLDLLLDLIRKQDIDIYDIPIAKITAQYLAYVERLRELDVNVAADFIYMAAVLIHIKSKMLLPRDPAVSSEEQEDPRAELVNRLIEHEKFKSAAQMLLQKQQIEDAVRSNPAIREFMEAEGTEPEIAAEVIDLVSAFQQVVQRIRTRPIIQVDEETVTVGQMIEYVRRRLALEESPIRLKQMLATVQSRQTLVCMFLALLELVRLQAIQLRQDRLFGEILVRKHAHFDEVMKTRDAVRDDWR